MFGIGFFEIYHSPPANNLLSPSLAVDMKTKSLVPVEERLDPCGWSRG